MFLAFVKRYKLFLARFNYISTCFTMFHYVSQYILTHFLACFDMFHHVSLTRFDMFHHVSTCFWNVLDHVISSWDVYDKFCYKIFLCSMFPWAMFLCEVPNIWKLIYLLLNSIKWNIWSLWPIVKVFSMPSKWTSDEILLPSKQIFAF
jgi:hypothetical protein